MDSVQPLSCLTTVANGHLSYEIFRGKPDLMGPAAKVLESQFGYAPEGDLIDGIDTYALRCVRGESVLNLGWDNWSGFFVFAEDDEGDQVVRQFAPVFDEMLGSPALEGMIE